MLFCFFGRIDDRANCSKGEMTHSGRIDIIFKIFLEDQNGQRPKKPKTKKDKESYATKKVKQIDLNRRDIYALRTHEI